MSAKALEQLAKRIKVDIERRDASRAEWIEATVDLCLALAEARDQFEADQSFGQWFDQSGIDLNHQDRAAAIAMGRNIERTREVLNMTKRLSLRHIYDNEFRFTHVGKPTNKPETDARLTHVGKTTNKPETRAKSKRDRARKVIDEFVAEGKPLDRDALIKASGVGKTTIYGAISDHRAEERALRTKHTVDMNEVDEKLAPFIHTLWVQGQQYPGTVSPNAVANVALAIQRQLDEWAGRPRSSLRDMMARLRKTVPNGASNGLSSEQIRNSASHPGTGGTNDEDDTVRHRTGERQ